MTGSDRGMRKVTKGWNVSCSRDGKVSTACISHLAPHRLLSGPRTVAQLPPFRTSSNLARVVQGSCHLQARFTLLLRPVPPALWAPTTRGHTWVRRASHFRKGAVVEVWRTPSGTGASFGARNHCISVERGLQRRTNRSMNLELA